MAKTPGSELVDAVADRFHTYLRRGVRLDGVVGRAHPDLDIEDIDTLLRIHFVLTEADSPDDVGVLDFMRSLEARIRRMKTSTTRSLKTFNGQVRGRIDWQQTIKSRARTGRSESPLYVCEQTEEDYDIDENLVLHQLLAVIYNILTNDLEPALAAPESHPWLTDWVGADANEPTTEAAVDTLRRIYEENIYLQRVGLDEQRVTARTIEAVKRSRGPLYREAAVLLDQYRQLMDRQLDAAEARAVLDNTLVVPDETEVLFELYWIFQVLDAYDGVTYKVLSDRNPSVVARWADDDYEYVMYHDAVGEGTTFSESPPEDIEEDGYLYRMSASIRRWEELSRELLDRESTGSLWGGRPDILLERYEDSQLDAVFVGEVKYTRDTGYAASGLRELLEYMAFVKRREGGRYVESQKDLLDSVDVQGLLFVDQADVQETIVDIDILQYGESVMRVI